jgi:hypothetical protein
MIISNSNSALHLLNSLNEGNKDSPELGQAFANMIFRMRESKAGAVERWTVTYGRDGFAYEFKKGMNSEPGEGKDAHSADVFEFLGALLSNYQVRYSNGGVGQSNLMRLDGKSNVYFGSSVVLNELFSEECASHPESPLSQEELERRGRIYFERLKKACA